MDKSLEILAVAHFDVFYAGCLENEHMDKPKPTGQNLQALKTIEHAIKYLQGGL